ncbi:MAG: DUF4194 domain-containing protein [bacterium]|jgi:hypothetical protein
MSSQRLIEVLSRLDEATAAKLGKALGKLLEAGIILKGPVMGQDPDFRILSREADAARAFLQFIGWNIQIDPLQGFARAVQDEGRCSVQFTKEQSIILCILRLLLQEKAAQATWDQDAVISLGEIREAYIHHSGDDRPLGKAVLAQSLKYFNRLNLVELERPFEPHDMATLRILPTLYATMPPENVSQVVSRLKEYLTRQATTQDRELITGDTGLEPREEGGGETPT